MTAAVALSVVVWNDVIGENVEFVGGDPDGAIACYRHLWVRVGSGEDG